VVPTGSTDGAVPPAVAWWRIAPPVLVVVVVLTAFSNGYGFDRDELYFAMLEPAWGYVDQPPFTPLLSHVLVSVYDGGPWLLRVPATMFAAGCVLLTALLARELGGGARAQAWTAWGVASTSAVTVFGHVFLTSTADLTLWPAICLCVLKAELHLRPRWWVTAGALAGLATYNRLLVGVLVAGIALGLLLVGPRRRLLSPYVLGGALLAALVALPNELYQVLNGWPEGDMGRALAANNAADTRTAMFPLLVVLFGPPLVVIWAAGLGALWRDRRVRFFVPAFGLLLVFTFVGGTQPHYPVFLLPLPFAAGVVAMERHLGRVWGALFAVNGVVSAFIGLPLLAVGSVGASPVPGINPLVGDSVGWPAYADQVTRLYDALPDGGHAAVVTSNYGEAGAVARYRPDVPVYSAQNALYDQARPPESVTTIVVVGGQYPEVRRLFAGCAVKARLDNGEDVDNEEQGEPVAVCHGPSAPWTVLWPRLHHLD
jgi:4-amino-4-deoxy-L-arabinose transferase-like glycosyltransferase